MAKASSQPQRDLDHRIKVGEIWARYEECKAEWEFLQHKMSTFRSTVKGFHDMFFVDPQSPHFFDTTDADRTTDIVELNFVKRDFEVMLAEIPTVSTGKKRKVIDTDTAGVVIQTPWPRRLVDPSLPNETHAETIRRDCPLAASLARRGNSFSLADPALQRGNDSADSAAGAAAGTPIGVTPIVLD
jgi:hypothetical protein